MNAVMTPDDRSQLPRTLGRYTLFEHVGRGGMAEIYLARAETELGATKLAVVKQILPAYAEDPRFSEMLIHEAKLAARLSHKHVVQVIDLGRTGGADDQLFIAMEYVEGFDLNALLRKCSELSIGLPVEHALGIVVDALQGLDYAHRAGIVHRDVSPSNVLISYEGEVKLCDFGIAHANDQLKEKEDEALKGKAGYMSPEHARGEEVDARSDVFAAGIILWELVAGRRLYKPRSEVPLIEQAQKAEIPPVPDRDLPNQAELAEIVMRALAVDREKRYQTAAAFARDLEKYLADAGLLASRLELGKWIASSFGTEQVDKRRASERALPKSAPPAPRSSERVRASKLAVPSAPEIPAPPRTPSDIVATGATTQTSDEPALDITPEPSMPIAPVKAKTDEPEHPHEAPIAPEPSLAAATVDLTHSSRDAVDPSATGKESSTDLAKAEDAPAIARRRSSVIWLVVALALAALIAVARHLVH
jgi:eukaryotic-like serine/threonine-protein kinase